MAIASRRRPAPTRRAVVAATSSVKNVQTWTPTPERETSSAGEMRRDDLVGQRKIRPVGLSTSEAAFDRRHPSGTTCAIVLLPKCVDILAPGKEVAEERDLVHWRRGVVDCSRQPAEKRGSRCLVGQGTRTAQTDESRQALVLAPEPLKLATELAQFCILQSSSRTRYRQGQPFLNPSLRSPRARRRPMRRQHRAPVSSASTDLVSLPCS